MAEESDTPGWTLKVQVGGGNDAEVKELVDGITQKVGEAAQLWQDRMKERAASAAAAREP
jgi:hypothetical protein